ATTFPAGGGKYRTASWNAGCATAGLCGTAADTGGAGLTRVELSIQEGSGNFYGGTSFDQASETFLTASGTTSWSYALGAAKLTSGQTYTLHLRAIDGADNVESQQSFSFLYDAVAPVSTPTFPVAGAAYRTATWSA